MNIVCHQCKLNIYYKVYTADPKDVKVKLKLIQLWFDFSIFYSEKTSSSVEETEPCFICNKRIPKSLYAKHVQDEIDKAEATELSQDAVQPRRGLRSKKATGVETSME